MLLRLLQLWNYHWLILEILLEKMFWFNFIKLTVEYFNGLKGLQIPNKSAGIRKFSSPWSISQWTQDVNWTYIRRSEDVQDVFWTSYVRSSYVLCLLGSFWNSLIALLTKRNRWSTCLNFSFITWISSSKFDEILFVRWRSPLIVVRL